MKLGLLLIGMHAIFGLTWAQNTGRTNSNATLRNVRLYLNDREALTSPERSVVRRETSIDFMTLMITGVYRDYNREGKLLADGTFHEGVMAGLQSRYFENGRVKSTIEFDDNGFIIWELSNEKGESQVTHGSGTFSIMYNDVESTGEGEQRKNKTLSGEFSRGTRTGTWTYADSAGQKTDEEFYEGGKLISRIEFDESGGARFVKTPKKSAVNISRRAIETLSFDKSAYHRLNEYFENNLPGYPGVAQRGITYPGGLKKMLLFISQNVAIPQSDDLYPVRMRVDEHGVVHFRFQQFIDPNVESKILQVLMVCAPKILPEVQNGKAISSSIRIPVANASWWIEFLKTASEEDIISYVKGIWYNK